MKPATNGQLLVAAIMALALVSFLAITHSVSKTADAGIYEIEVSNLPDGIWLPAEELAPDRIAPHYGREKSRR